MVVRVTVLLSSWLRVRASSTSVIWPLSPTSLSSLLLAHYPATQLRYTRVRHIRTHPFTSSHHVRTSPARPKSPRQTPWPKLTPTSRLSPSACVLRSQGGSLGGPPSAFPGSNEQKGVTGPGPTPENPGGVRPVASLHLVPPSRSSELTPFPPSFYLPSLFSVSLSRHHYSLSPVLRSSPNRTPPPRSPRPPPLRPCISPPTTGRRTLLSRSRPRRMRRSQEGRRRGDRARRKRMLGSSRRRGDCSAIRLGWVEGAVASPFPPPPKPLSSLSLT